jgi:hypothetical protein
MLQELSKITFEEKQKNLKALKEFQFAFLSENIFEIENKETIMHPKIKNCAS